MQVPRLRALLVIFFHHTGIVFPSYFRILAYPYPGGFLDRGRYISDADHIILFRLGLGLQRYDTTPDVYLRL
jgi:hypothetical protein